MLPTPICRGSSELPRIAVVGAGLAGTQLAFGLLAAACEVTLVSNRTPEDIRRGPVLSSQCMFESALQTERALGLAWWDDTCPPIEGIAITATDGDGGVAFAWGATLDAPALSVDQRLKLPAWIEETERLGATVEILDVDVTELERLARTHDLVVVATGKGDLGRLFPRDPELSVFDRPQRALALTYVTGMEPRAGHSAVCFNLAPGIGEYFVFPALTASGPCEIMVFEGVPGGPLDCWEDVRSPSEHLLRSRELLQRHFPWEAERCRSVELTDGHGVLTGRLAPVVRRPVAHLPSGAAVVGMADAVVLNDPITGQGANSAARAAEVYGEAILERGDGPFGEDWMQATADRYWLGYGQWVTKWTNTLLLPPQPHMIEILREAAEVPSLAATIANGFDDPRVFFPWWFDAGEAGRLGTERRRRERHDRFDRRDLRRALGQFATGVTVVTTRAPDGRRLGLTANSFTSVSLDPPLVLWCLARSSASSDAFLDSSHFAINVLSADQHSLSRRFATPGIDRFEGVVTTDGSGGMPILDGVIASFVCRHVTHHDAGDHQVFIGEVEEYATAPGEPLVFHSGSYRVVTRHPELEPEQ